MNEMTRVLHHLKKEYKKTSFLHNEKSANITFKHGQEGEPRAKKSFKNHRTGSKMIGEV